MTTPRDVWILWHLPPGGDPDDGMLIGVYLSRDDAAAAVDRLKDKPGFRDHPTVTEDDTEPGFFMQSYELGKDHWADGYQHVTFGNAD
jgi:hypothetical protein